MTELTPGEVRIGTSGWSYDHWKDVLYPPGAYSKRLESYVAEFDSVELNASFYRWPRATMFQRWRDKLPAGFLMTVKAPRGLTHARKLRDPEVWGSRIDDGLRALGDPTGFLLFQLPPDLERDDDRLAHALEAMPRGVRTAVELRHPSWDREEVYRMLERHGAAYCVMSGAQLPCVLRATAETVYVRLHGPDDRRLYVGSYSDDDLRWWAARIDEWRNGGHSVVAYFNNDGEGHAVRNARRLKELLGL